jgi:hypothetical protein
MDGSTRRGVCAGMEEVAKRPNCAEVATPEEEEV